MAALVLIEMSNVTKTPLTGRLNAAATLGPALRRRHAQLCLPLHSRRLSCCFNLFHLLIFYTMLWVSWMCQSFMCAPAFMARTVSILTSVPEKAYEHDLEEEEEKRCLSMVFPYESEARDIITLL